MSQKQGSQSRKARRRALLAAAGIVGAAAAGTGAGAAEIAPSAIHVTSDGVLIHDAALAAALISDKAGAVSALQSKFPGLTPDQIGVGPDNTVTLTLRREAASGQGHTIAHPNGTNNGCTPTNNGCTNTMCHHPILSPDRVQIPRYQSPNDVRVKTPHHHQK
jgi:hypothetical protein